MTTTTSSDFPSFHICTNCGHEHQAVDLDEIVIIDAEGFVRQVMCADEIKDGTSVLCADEDACERRMGRMEPLPDDAEDPGIDPPFDYSEEEGEPFDCEDLTGQDMEDAAPAHLDGDPDEGQPADDFYGDDAAFDEYRMDQGWDD